MALSDYDHSGYVCPCNAFGIDGDPDHGPDEQTKIINVCTNETK